MRIEPDITLNEPSEAIARPLQEIVLGRPLDRQPGADRDRRFCRGVDDLRLIVDVIDPKLDLMPDAAGLDDRHSGGSGIAADLAIEHIAHGENGLQRIALRAAGRRDISLAAGNPDRIIEDGLDGLGVDPARIVLDGDRSRIDDDLDHRGNLGLLGGIEGVVHDLLAHHQRPLIERVPSLVLKLALGAKFHQSRDLEGHSRQLRLGFLASGGFGLCHNLYKSRPVGRFYPSSPPARMPFAFSAARFLNHVRRLIPSAIQGRRASIDLWFFGRPRPRRFSVWTASCSSCDGSAAVALSLIPASVAAASSSDVGCACNVARMASPSWRITAG
jgi:hypothetical protein